MADRSFQLQRQLGDGTFGTVYLADMVSTGGFRKSVAIKLLKQDWDAASDAARRLRDEARLLGRLRHRHIVAVDDLIRLDGRWAVVMEYVPGVDLQAIIEAAADAGERVPPAAALEITAAVAQALDAAWNGPAADGGAPLRVVHRDIKPGNIRLTADGDVKVLDFGIARADFQGREARTDRIRYGSVGYMAPERLLGDPEVPAGDVYAVGVVLWELLTLRPYGRTALVPERAHAELQRRLAQARALWGPELDPVLDLVAACLDYAVGARPTAAELAERARSLARRIPGPDLMAFARDLVPRVAGAEPGVAIPPRHLTEEQPDSATFPSVAPDHGATAVPLTTDHGAATAVPVPDPGEGTLGHELPAKEARRRGPVVATALLVAGAVVAGGLGLWARARPEALPNTTAAIAGSPLPTAPASSHQAAGSGGAVAPPPPDEAPGPPDNPAESAAASAAGATAAPADPAADDPGGSSPTAAGSHAHRSSTPGDPARTAESAAVTSATATSATATSATATSATATSTAAPSARSASPPTSSGAASSADPIAGGSPSSGAGTTDSPRVDRAKFFVPRASRVEVDCGGVSQASSSSSVYVRDFPAGTCRVRARVDGRDLHATVTVPRPAGYTCTPTSATLTCETM